MNDRLDTLVSSWTRIGAGFAAHPAPETPDLERLLLDTARSAPPMARLFIMAATWLHRYADLVATHRLRRLIRDELDPPHRPVLGLLLDAAQQGTHPPQFGALTRALPAERDPHPLFQVEQISPALAERARRRASPLSLRWGLWCEEFELKTDALRPPSWVMKHNPRFITRADFRGDLRASILAALEHDRDAGLSELHLARCAGGSRSQVRNALDNLELTGKAARERADNERRTRIRLLPPAPYPAPPAPARRRSA